MAGRFQAGEVYKLSEDYDKHYTFRILSETKGHRYEVTIVDIAGYSSSIMSKFAAGSIHDFYLSPNDERFEHIIFDLGLGIC